MFTRSFLLVTGIAALAGLGACKPRYADTFSFKKNSFVAPAPERTEIPPVPTEPTLQPTSAPSPVPGAPAPIPGLTVPPPGGSTGIPGLDVLPAPAPEAPPETTP